MSTASVKSTTTLPPSHPEAASEAVKAAVIEYLKAHGYAQTEATLRRESATVAPSGA